MRREGGRRKGGGGRGEDVRLLDCAHTVKSIIMTQQLVIVRCNSLSGTFQ